MSETKAKQPRPQPYGTPPPAGKPKGGGKGGKGGDKAPKELAPAPKGSFIAKDPVSGTGYCVQWNLNRPCKCDGVFNSKSCPYLNVCNWAKCKDRTKCKGSWWHRQNPGKGVVQ